MIQRVRYHILRDTAVPQTLSRDPDSVPQEVKENHVAFTCLLPAPREGVLYCGITALNNDILHTFDLKTRQFRSLNYRSVAEKFEVKIHRSLEMAADGTIYGASACLHEPDQRLEAPGGALFRLVAQPPSAVMNPDSQARAPVPQRRTEKLCIPCPHDYIQTITLDDRRGLLYGFTYPVFKFFVYRIATGEVEDHDYVGSITHISAMDDAGRLWGTWHNRRHFLFSYDPDTRAIRFTRNALPGAERDADRMYPGAGPVDVMINGGDGFLYIGSTGGALYRLDPKEATATWLGKPFPAARMPGLKVWRDGLLLGVGGDDRNVQAFTYDRRSGALQSLGPVVAQDGLPLHRPHDIALVGDTLFIAETDVPERSGHLWECELG